jgi:hypothetical protein
MFRRTLSRINRLLGQFSGSPTCTKLPHALRCRPALEVLDARVVPAVWTDATGNGLFSDPGNWSNNAKPVDGDNLIFRAPNPSIGLVGSTDNVSGMSGTFADVGIDSSYTGIITFSGAVNVTTFYEQDGGTISQPTSTSDLTIQGTGIFNWTGGTIGTTNSGATIHLAGATATISPGAGNTITTSDTISLESGTDPTSGNTIGTTATFNPGVLGLTGGGGITVGAFCNANVVPKDTAVVGFVNLDTQTDPKSMTLTDATSGLKVYPGYWGGQGLKLNNQGGTAEFLDGSVSYFGPVPQNPPPQNPPPAQAYITQAAGTLKLHSGATLGVQTGGFTVVSGGTFAIVADSPAPQQANAKLDSDLTFSGGVIGFIGNYWTFEVTGNVTWSAGTYAPRVDVTGAVADIWQMDKTLKITPDTSTAVLAPSSINYQNGLPAGFQVKIFDILGGGVAGSGQLKLVNQNPGPVYGYRPAGGTGNELLGFLIPG